MNKQKDQTEAANGQSALADGLWVACMDDGELLDGAAVRSDDRVIAMSDLCEDEFDSSGELDVGNRLGLWEYFCLLKSLDPITRRDILGLQASNFLLKLRILRLGPPAEGSRLSARVMFATKKWMAQPLSRLGLILAEEEHEQEYGEMYQLFEAQRQLYCQFQHGISPVYAGSAANWLGLAIYYTPLRGVALGLPRMALSVGWIGFGVSLQHHAEGAIANVTLSRVVARQLGLLAQVRCPARDSARVIHETYVC